MNAEQLTALPLAERLRAMEALWESLCRDAGESLPSPAWHDDVLAERARRLAAGEDAASDWNDAKRRLREATAEKQ
jgi:hypothetical protein